MNLHEGVGIAGTKDVHQLSLRFEVEETSSLRVRQLGRETQERRVTSSQKATGVSKDDGSEWRAELAFLVTVLDFCQVLAIATHIDM